MATVRKALPSDFEGVYELLRNSTLNSKGLPKENRLRMFQNHWNSSEDYFGYVLEDDSAVVGFMGLMFSRRRVGGAEHKFCEVHSWYVKEEYRNESLNLFFPLLGLKGYEITNLTPTAGVAEIQKKFGFLDLETHLRLIFALPTPGMWTKVAIELDADVIEKELSGRDLEVLIDHRHINCSHVLLTGAGGERLYLVVKKLRRRFFEHYGRVFYLSDLPLFMKYLPVLRTKVAWALRCNLLVMNEDALKGNRPILSKVIPREVPSIYKSKKLGRDDIDHLYSTPLVLDYRMQ